MVYMAYNIFTCYCVHIRSIKSNILGMTLLYFNESCYSGKLSKQYKLVKTVIIRNV